MSLSLFLLDPRCYQLGWSRIDRDHAEASHCHAKTRWQDWSDAGIRRRAFQQKVKKTVKSYLDDPGMEKIWPLIHGLFSRWGFLSRAGLWDKSHLMRQIEKYLCMPLLCISEQLVSSNWAHILTTLRFPKNWFQVCWYIHFKSLQLPQLHTLHVFPLSRAGKLESDY